METRNITAGPNQARLIQSLADSMKDAKTEISFEIEGADGTETLVGVIRSLEYNETHGGHYIRFGGRFKGHGYLKGWYNYYTRKGHIEIH